MWTYSEQLTMYEARKRYFNLAQFPTESSNSKFAIYPIGPLKIPIPNTSVIDLHDYHHVITGFDTSWRDEFQISAWELGSGGGRTLGSWIFVLSGFYWGSFLFPKHNFKAFRDGRAYKNLYRQDISHLNTRSIKEVKVLIKKNNTNDSKKWKSTCIFFLYFTTLFAFNMAFIYTCRQFAS